MDLKRDRDDVGSSSPPVAPAARCRTEDGAAVVAPSESMNPFNGKPFTRRYYDILRQRRQLPVYAQRDAILQAVLGNPVTLLVGETGSGKTTQVPHFIAELQQSLPGIVACTQPRRIAAVSVAARVADEMDVRLGDEVGYHVRFQSKRGDRTRVLYMTDGMLLREALSDGDLSQYGVVVVDEAHERTVGTDVVLGVLKLLSARRPNFRLVVMSATMDIAKIKAFFPDAPLITVSGRMYDVTVQYSATPVKDYVAAAVDQAFTIHAKEPTGDILCFLTGEAEVNRAVSALKSFLGDDVVDPATAQAEDNVAGASAEAGGGTHGDGSAATCPRRAVVLPLFGALNMTEQQRVFQAYPPNVRKIVFCTNIAETSVTIDGIVYVVDSGYQKQDLYSSEARVDYLLPTVISKASAEQRKGRAGRTRPGKCFRLFTEADFSGFPAQNHAEILRTNVVGTVLLLLSLGVTNVLTFPFLDMPSDEGLADAFYQLTYFEAVDEELQLTDFGRQLALLPLSVSFARMLLKAPRHGCASDVAAVAAMLEVGNVFTRSPSHPAESDQAHRALAHPDGDHVTLLLVFQAFLRHSNSVRGGAEDFCRRHFLRLQALQQAVQVYHHLCTRLRRHNVPIASTYNAETHTVDTRALRKAVLEGFFTQVAYRPPTAPGSGGGAKDEECLYRTVRDGTRLRLHEKSVLHPATRRKLGRSLPVWIMYDRLEMHGQGGTFVRVGSPIEVDWLLDTGRYYDELTEIPDGEIAYVLKQARMQRDAQKTGQ